MYNELYLQWHCDKIKAIEIGVGKYLMICIGM